jgi:hypothetical protein
MFPNQIWKIIWSYASGLVSKRIEASLIIEQLVHVEYWKQDLNFQTRYMIDWMITLPNSTWYTKIYILPVNSTTILPVKKFAVLMRPETNLIDFISSILKIISLESISVWSSPILSPLLLFYIPIRLLIFESVDVISLECHLYITWF